MNIPGTKSHSLLTNLRWMSVFPEARKAKSAQAAPNMRILATSSLILPMSSSCFSLQNTFFLEKSPVLTMHSLRGLSPLCFRGMPFMVAPFSLSAMYTSPRAGRLTMEKTGCLSTISAI